MFFLHPTVTSFIHKISLIMRKVINNVPTPGNIQIKMIYNPLTHIFFII